MSGFMREDSGDAADGGETLSESDAYQKAVALLAKREHSVAELLGKLHARRVSPETAETVLARLIEERLQSDERYTEVYLRQRSDKGYGPLRIKAELRERGIDATLVSRLLQQLEADGELDWYERAAAAYRKKYGGSAIEDIKERARRVRFMQYRGFDHEQISSVLDDE